MCLIQRLRFLVSYNHRRGPRKQVCLEASLRFSGVCTPFLPFPPQVLGRPGGRGKGSSSVWPVQPLHTHLPPRALLVLVTGLSPQSDMPGLKSQLLDDQLCDLR